MLQFVLLCLLSCHGYESAPCEDVKGAYRDPGTGVLHDCRPVCEHTAENFQRHCQTYCPEFYECWRDHLDNPKRTTSTFTSVITTIVITQTSPPGSIVSGVAVLSIVLAALLVASIIMVMLFCWLRHVRKKRQSSEDNTVGNDHIDDGIATMESPATPEEGPSTKYQNSYLNKDKSASGSYNTQSKPESSPDEPQHYHAHAYGAATSPTTPKSLTFPRAESNKTIHSTRDSDGRIDAVQIQPPTSAGDTNEDPGASLTKSLVCQESGNYENCENPGKAPICRKRSLEEYESMYLSSLEKKRNQEQPQNSRSGPGSGLQPQSTASQTLGSMPRATSFCHPSQEEAELPPLSQEEVGYQVTGEEFRRRRTANAVPEEAAVAVDPASSGHSSMSSLRSVPNRVHPIPDTGYVSLSRPAYDDDEDEDSFSETSLLYEGDANHPDATDLKTYRR